MVENKSDKVKEGALMGLGAIGAWLLVKGVGKVLQVGGAVVTAGVAMAQAAMAGAEDEEGTKRGKRAA